MDKGKLESAIAEAERFLARAKPTLGGYQWEDWPAGGGWFHSQSSDTAATKRASMDLTRALADLRKPE